MFRTLWLVVDWFDMVAWLVTLAAIIWRESIWPANKLVTFAVAVFSGPIFALGWLCAGWDATYKAYSVLGTFISGAIAKALRADDRLNPATD
ncbi:MAG: hypothetical protein EXS68_01120 [Candidatus Ryanbacteria bacterium]|nr:hypothetical protein [Candidatus Ryanbacteria bacterium]